MRRRQAHGYTLIEVTIALAIGTLIFLTIGALTKASADSMDYLSRTHRVDRDLRRSLDWICEELKTASLAGIALDQSDADHDSIEYQTEQGGSWGYPNKLGVFQPNWSARLVVNGADLVLQRLNPGGAQQSTKILCRHVDVAFDDGTSTTKGFAVDINGELVTLQLRVHERFDDGRDYRRTERTLVHVVND
ncbi:MAG: prepilin-type N-terminal cleavage/methylation domain-containing protein [Planctomycetes bacterium]|nr:prepilin-type N-terminal cleavage/methylation domain-containing protein [Planctomycetota bacterium]